MFPHQSAEATAWCGEAAFTSFSSLAKFVQGLGLTPAPTYTPALAVLFHGISLEDESKHFDANETQLERVVVYHILLTYIYILYKVKSDEWCINNI